LLEDESSPFFGKGVDSSGGVELVAGGSTFFMVVSSLLFGLLSMNNSALFCPARRSSWAGFFSWYWQNPCRWPPVQIIVAGVEPKQLFVKCKRSVNGTAKKEKRVTGKEDVTP